MCPGRDGAGTGGRLCRSCGAEAERDAARVDAAARVDDPARDHDPARIDDADDATRADDAASRSATHGQRHQQVGRDLSH